MMFDPFITKIFGQAFFKRVVLQPLRRLITPIGFGDKILKLKYLSGFRSSLFSKGLQASSFFKRVVITPTTQFLLGFSVKPFQKRLAVKVIKYI
jgi:hypothetical protein